MKLSYRINTGDLASALRGLLRQTIQEANLPEAKRAGQPKIQNRQTRNARFGARSNLSTTIRGKR